MKQTKYFQLYAALKEFGDEGCSVKTLEEHLGFKSNNGLPVYVHALRTKYGANIESIRNGRTVVAYRLLNAGDISVPEERKPRTTKNRRVVKKPAKPRPTKRKIKVATVQQRDRVNASIEKKRRLVDESVCLDEDFDSGYDQRELEDLRTALGI